MRVLLECSKSHIQQSIARSFNICNNRKNCQKKKLPHHFYYLGNNFTTPMKLPLLLKISCYIYIYIFIMCSTKNVGPKKQTSTNVQHDCCQIICWINSWSVRLGRGSFLFSMLVVCLLLWNSWLENKYYYFNKANHDFMQIYIWNEFRSSLLFSSTILVWLMF